MSKLTSPRIRNAKNPEALAKAVRSYLVGLYCDGEKYSPLPESIQVTDKCVYNGEKVFGVCWEGGPYDWSIDEIDNDHLLCEASYSFAFNIYKK